MLGSIPEQLSDRVVRGKRLAYGDGLHIRQAMALCLR